MYRILITGATGTIGKAIVEILTNQNVPFKAAVRDVEIASSKLQLERRFLVEFDYSNPESFAGAVEGIDRVVLITPPMQPDTVGLVTPFIDFLKNETSIKRVVFSGGMGMGKDPATDDHKIIGDMLKVKGFEYTFLLPTFFAQNFKNYEYDNIMQRGITFNVAGEGKVAFIDVYDIARVAAKVLTEPGHEYKSYELTGPDLLSHFEAADILSEVLNKKIIYPNPSEEDYTLALKSAGVPDFVAPAMIDIYSKIKENKVNYITDVVEQISGKKPTPLKRVIQNDFATHLNN